MDVIIHPHALKHGLTEDEVCYAWENFVRRQSRATPRTDQIVAIGVTRQGKMVQMIGIMKPYGTLVYHALTPPTKKFLKELDMLGR